MTRQQVTVPSQGQYQFMFNTTYSFNNVILPIVLDPTHYEASVAPGNSII